MLVALSDFLTLTNSVTCYSASHDIQSITGSRKVGQNIGGSFSDLLYFKSSITGKSVSQWLLDVSLDLVV